MRVSSRPKTRAVGRISGGRRHPPSPAEQWVREAAALFRSASAADRERAAAMVERDVTFAGGPSFAPDALLAGLRREVESGELRAVPEAHLALAGALVDVGDAAAGLDHVWSAIHTAGAIAASDLVADRARASQVNLGAARIFYRTGDAYQARARHAISRYFAATELNRRHWFPVAWDPARPGGAAMRAPEPAVPVPRGLARAAEEREPEPAPEVGEPVSGMMGVVELLNTASAYVEVFRKTAEAARYNEARERAAFFRDFVPVPPPPEVLREAERFVEAHLGDGPPLGPAARRARRTVDFRFLEECSRAFWGM
jgi:hypothetical protein